MANLNSRLTIPAGETIFGPVQTPVAMTQLTITLNRNAWPDRGQTRIILWSIQISDDQVTWVPQGEGNAGGGVKSKNFTAQTVNFKSAVPAGTWIRAVVNATEPLDTQAGATWQ